MIALTKGKEFPEGWCPHELCLLNRDSRCLVGIGNRGEGFLCPFYFLRNGEGTVRVANQGKLMGHFDHFFEKVVSAFKEQGAVNPETVRRY